MILKLKSVKSIMEKYWKLASASNQGMKFNQELKRQQALQMPTEKILELIQDVVTRYTLFICYMFDSNLLFSTFNHCMLFKTWILLRNSFLQLLALKRHCRAHKMRRPYSCTTRDYSYHVTFCLQDSRLEFSSEIHLFN